LDCKYRLTPQTKYENDLRKLKRVVSQIEKNKSSQPTELEEDFYQKLHEAVTMCEQMNGVMFPQSGEIMSEMAQQMSEAVCDFTDFCCVYLVYQNDCDDLEPQSGSIEQSYNLTSTVKEQNVRFSDQYTGPQTTLSSRKDITRSVADTNDTQLGDFLSRPIKIADYTWSTGGFLNATFNPWTLFFTNPRVENRLNNYNLIRADLHLKVVVNGNGFYYGRGLFCYGPFGGPTQDTLSQTTAIQDLVQWSQRPKIFIDPTNSMGGEMVIPWHYYRNNGWTQNQFWASEMGQIWIYSPNILKHANGGTEPVTVSVFAWAENVDLSVLTSMDMGGLTPQSGELELFPQAGDETEEANSKGVISGPASAIAKWAGYLSSIPVIGPYATATSKAAGLTSEIASSFGYCKPVITKAPEPYRPTPVSALANVNVPDVTNKLSVDHKQELTIDPVIAGIGESDLLSIKSIASRESYLATFSWPKTSVAESLLWNMRIDPVQWATTGTDFLFPACAMAALPFRYWTGTMKIRFQIVASAFHKGRLKFVYDPNQIDGTEYNINYMKIVDIASEQDVTLEIGLGQADTLLGHAYPGTTLLTAMQNTTSLNYASDIGNGILGVYVVNTLTTPESVVNNDIEINVYVSMGDDFEVFVPDPYYQNFVFEPQSGSLEDLVLEPQSGEISGMTVPESEHTDEPNAPIQTKSESIAVESTNLPETNLVFTGECISSFRSMLKRYNRFTAFCPTDYLAMEMHYQANAFPFLRGNVAGAVHTRVGPAQYNFCNTVLLHWVTYAFSGWRGAIRWKMIPKKTAKSSVSTVSRHVGSSAFGGYSFTTSVANNYTSEDAAAQSVVYVSGTTDREQSGHEGVAYTNSEVNPVLEWEMPFYNKYRFKHGKVQNLTQGDDNLEYFSLETTTWQENQAYGTFDYPGVYELWVAAGEDFQTYFWTGLPRMYFEASVPVAA
jgi:hypothetical protein